MRQLIMMASMLISALSFGQANESTMELLAKAAESQLNGEYNYYDASERPVDENGLIKGSAGCCIDVVLRAWHEAVAKGDSDKEITALLRSYVFQKNQNPEQVYKNMGGQRLAHRRCRNVIKMFKSKFVDCTITDTPKRGSLIFFIDNGNCWHVAIGTSDTTMIHNIGAGVQEVEYCTYGGDIVCVNMDK